MVILRFDCDAGSQKQERQYAVPRPLSRHLKAQRGLDQPDRHVRLAHLLERGIGRNDGCVEHRTRAREVKPLRLDEEWTAQPNVIARSEGHARFGAQANRALVGVDIGDGEADSLRLLEEAVGRVDTLGPGAADAAHHHHNEKPTKTNVHVLRYQSSKVRAKLDLAIKLGKPLAGTRTGFPVYLPLSPLYSCHSKGLMISRRLLGTALIAVGAVACGENGTGP